MRVPATVHTACAPPSEPLLLAAAPRARRQAGQLVWQPCPRGPDWKRGAAATHAPSWEVRRWLFSRYQWVCWGGGKVEAERGRRVGWAVSAATFSSGARLAVQCSCHSWSILEGEQVDIGADSSSWECGKV